MHQATSNLPFQSGRTQGTISARFAAAAVVSMMFLFASPISALGLPGHALMVGAAMISALMLLFSMPVLLVPTVCAGAALVLIYITGSVGSFYADQGIRHTLSAFSVIVAFCFFVRFGGQLAESRLWRVAVYVGCAIAIAAVSVAGMPKNITGGTMTYILAIAAVLYLRSTRGAGGMVALVFVVVAIAIGLLMEFRAILAYAVVLLAVRYGVRVFPRWLAFWGGIAAVIAAAWLAVWFFSNLYSSETAAVVRQWIEAQTGRRVESGREWLWPMILNTVGPQPWFGLGSGVLPRDFLSTDYSAHNYYIQTIMQVGYVGLGALGLYLASVWRLLIGVRNAAAGAFAAGVMVMFCLHNITEVLMFQNGLTAGLPAWISIGLGIGASVKACSNSKA